MKNHQLTCENEQLIQHILALETQLSEQQTVLDENKKAISVHQKTLKTKNKTLLKKNVLIGQKSDKIATLEEYICYMTQQRFGASSEKLSLNQLGLFDEAELLSDEDESEETCTEVPAHQRKNKRLSLPENLPTSDIIHDLPEDEQCCPHDNQALRHFGDECSKQLDYIPAKVTVLKHIRRKYMSPCCNDYFVTATKPTQPIEKYHARQQESIPILAALKKWLDKSLKYPVKSEKPTKTLTYLNNQWAKLIRYTENSAWPMDHNLAENSIRPFVIGRKNWLFAATVKGKKPVLIDTA
ncbi:MAG: transposase [Colwellia sp.]|nr:transposase [Colwellia sp.]